MPGFRIIKYALLLRRLEPDRVQPGKMKRKGKDMTFRWNKDTIRWYKSANAFTSFYKNIADSITNIEKTETLCDLGCGLGLIDLEMAPRLKKIDCFDICVPVLDSLNADIAERGIRNIDTHLQDCNTVSGHWNIALMCYFGTNELDRYLKLCKRLIAVVGRPSRDGLFPSKYRKDKNNTVEHTRRYLDERRISYMLTEREFEFGQPLKTLEDAREFVAAHAPEATDAEIDEFLNDRLIKTQDETYRYYLPRKKPVGIFELRGGG
jgi:hypothetical protein